MTNEAHDLLMGSGGVSATWPEVGTVHQGEVLAYEKRQQRDMKTGEKKFWDEERTEPMWQIVFTLQTDERDSSVDDDDGVRNVYAKAQMLAAIRDAVKKSGHKGNLVGGVLAVKYDGDGEASARGFNPPKLYKAKYQPPAVTQEFAESRRDVESFEKDYGDMGEEPF